MVIRKLRFLIEALQSIEHDPAETDGANLEIWLGPNPIGITDVGMTEEAEVTFALFIGNRDHGTGKYFVHACIPLPDRIGFTHKQEWKKGVVIQ